MGDKIENPFTHPALTASVNEVLRLRKIQPRGEALPLVREMKFVTENLFILPICADYALSWIAGKLDDEQIFFHAPLKNEVVFAMNLPKGKLLESISAVNELYRLGCVAMVGRANRLEWLAVLQKRGAVETAIETDEFNSRRYVLPPPHFKNWFVEYQGLVKSKKIPSGTLSPV
jgi:hypothetical protein